MPSKAAIIATSAAAAVLLAGGGVATAIALSGNDEPDQSHSVLTAKGEYILAKGFHFGAVEGTCYADAIQHPDVKADATVTIRDEAGKIVGAGPIAAGVVAPDKQHCEFKFRIGPVQTGAKFYTVTLDSSAPITVSSTELFAGAFLNVG